MEERERKRKRLFDEHTTGVLCVVVQSEMCGDAGGACKHGARFLLTDFCVVLRAPADSSLRARSRGVARVCVTRGSSNLNEESEHTRLGESEREGDAYAIYERPEASVGSFRARSFERRRTE